MKKIIFTLIFGILLSAFIIQVILPQFMVSYDVVNPFETNQIQTELIKSLYYGYKMQIIIILVCFLPFILTSISYARKMINKNKNKKTEEK